ncbi:MAG TPA: hypothetical protein VJL39_01820 [Candidatus Paceibacterota bacterium]
MDEKYPNDDIFYSEVQATLRTYDAKLWTIPGLFFTIVGFAFFYLQNQSAGPKKGVALLLSAVAMWALILLYNKAHIFHISAQKKINEFDRAHKEREPNAISRIPLTSMTRGELLSRLAELEKQGATFGNVQIFFGLLTVSWWVRTSMLVIFFLTSLGSVYYLLPTIL